MTTFLYRKSLIDDEELAVASSFFNVTNCMVGIQNELVIGRYSCVPFYDEVENGLRVQNSKLINSFHEHNYIAQFHYYHDIEEYTPKTWFRLRDVPEGGPYVVKGVTNSKKQQWDTMMYAPDKSHAIKIALELQKDYWFSGQDVIIRKYEPMIKLGDSINGLQFTNEWRCFYYKKQLLSTGFYWSESDVKGQMDDNGLQFVQKIADIVGENTNFYTIDIGQKINGTWMVVELNDGQMAGFSDNNPTQLYSNLSKCIENNHNNLT